MAFLLHVIQCKLMLTEVYLLWLSRVVPCQKLLEIPLNKNFNAWRVISVVCGLNIQNTSQEYLVFYNNFKKYATLTEKSAVIRALNVYLRTDDLQLNFIYW